MPGQRLSDSQIARVPDATRKRELTTKVGALRAVERDKAPILAAKREGVGDIVQLPGNGEVKAPMAMPRGFGLAEGWRKGFDKSPERN
jgi:hypothetical protein